MFRTMYVEHDASIFADLLGELRESPLFCRLWSATNVGRPATALLRLRLDDRQLLRLNSIRAQQPELPGLTLFMQSPADDASRAILEGMQTSAEGRRNTAYGIVLPSAAPTGPTTAVPLTVPA
jgi:hypothetical protein